MRFDPLRRVRFGFALLVALSSLPASSHRAVASNGRQPDITLPNASFTTGEGGIRGSGLLLKLHSDNTFSLECSTCTGADRTDGSARVVDGQVQLGVDIQKAYSKLIPIEWGKRAYLVYQENMVDFCNDVNGGIEPRTDDWNPTALLRLNDWKKPVSGLPAIPAQWAGMLLPAPVTGHVTSVKEISAAEKAAANKAGQFIADHEMTIDLGTDNRVFVGMRLWLSLKNQPVPMKVTSVEKDQCIARPEYESIAPDVGTSVSSRRS